MKAKLRVEYVARKKGTEPSIHVKAPGKCAMCPSTWSLTRHHVFGSSDRLTISLCRNCHHMVHAEVNNGMAGAFTRHLFQLLAQCFPATAPLPTWSAEG